MPDYRVETAVGVIVVVLATVGLGLGVGFYFPANGPVSSSLRTAGSSPSAGGSIGSTSTTTSFLPSQTSTTSSLINSSQTRGVASTVTGTVTTTVTSVTTYTVSPPCYNAPSNCASVALIGANLTVQARGNFLFLAVRNTGNVPIASITVTLGGQLVGLLNQSLSLNQKIVAAIPVPNSIQVVVGQGYAVALDPTVQSSYAPAVEYITRINVTATAG